MTILQQVIVCALVMVIVALPIIWFCLRIILSHWAEDDRLVTFRREGRIMFLMEGGEVQENGQWKGGVLIRIIYKLSGYVLIHDPTDSQNPYKFQEQQGAGNEQASWLEYFLGVYWKGLPPRQIMYYLNVYQREIRTNDPPDNPNYIRNEDGRIMRRTSTTDYLAFRSVYPLFVRKIILRDFFKVSIRGTLTVQVFDPYTPIITLGGAWFPQVLSAFEGALTNVLRTFDIKEFEQLVKIGVKDPTTGLVEPSDFQKVLVESMNGAGGVKYTTGMSIVAFDYESYKVEDSEERESEKAQELAKLNVQGKIATAEGEAKARVATAEGKAQALVIRRNAKAQTIVTIGNAKAEALLKIGSSKARVFRRKRTALGSPEAAQTVISAEELADGLGSFQTKPGATLVIGKGASNVLLSTAAVPPKVPQVPKSETPSTPASPPATTVTPKPVLTPAPPTAKPKPNPTPSSPAKKPKRKRR